MQLTVLLSLASQDIAESARQVPTVSPSPLPRLAAQPDKPILQALAKDPLVYLQN